MNRVFKSIQASLFCALFLVPSLGFSQSKPLRDIKVGYPLGGSSSYFWVAYRSGSFEKHGLKFQSMEVSPQALTQKTVDEFIRFVKDNNEQPLFVYDKDSSLADGMWYLYFRLADQLPEAEARAKAGQLGFKETGDSLPMWLAIQKFLSERR